MNKALLSVGCALWIALAFLCAVPQEAHACSCAAAPSVQEALQRSAAVFSGKVIRIEDKRGVIRSSAEPVAVTFAVANVWKGELRKEMTIRTALSEASCGYGFEQNQEYIVYAAPDANGNLQTNLCSRTKPIRVAADDLAGLGAGQQPDGVKLQPDGAGQRPKGLSQQPDGVGQQPNGTEASPGHGGPLSAKQWVYLAADFCLGYLVSLQAFRILYGMYLTRRYVADLRAAPQTSEQTRPSEDHFGRRGPTIRRFHVLLSLVAALLFTWIVYLVMTT